MILIQNKKRKKKRKRQKTKESLRFKWLGMLKKIIFNDNRAFIKEICKYILGIKIFTNLYNEVKTVFNFFKIILNLHERTANKENPL